MSLRSVPVLIPLLFFLGALLIPLIARRRPALAWSIAVLSTIAAGTLAIIGLAEVLSTGPIRHHLGGWQPPMGIEFVFDGLSGFVATVIVVVAAIVLLPAGPLTRAELPGREAPFYSLAMLLMGGLTGMVLTGDLFNLYVFLEISSLASYALVATGGGRSRVAAFRYLIQGSIGGAFYLLGVGFLLALTGSLNMADLEKILPAIPESPALWIALVLMVLGLGLKMALFPMHSWLPDAYTTASSAVSALIAPIGTKVAAYVLLRLLFSTFQPLLLKTNIPLAEVIGWLGTAGILWGSIMAIAQTDLKRMLAYSSIAQVGYVGLGIGLGTPYGLIGAILHILNHACMKSCLFLVSGNYFTRYGHTNMNELSGVVRAQMPWTTASLAVAAFSMIGLPPTAGFFSKWYLILGSFQKGAWIFIVVLLASSLLNAVYFIRLLERVYLGASEDPPKSAMLMHEGVGRTMVLPVVILALGLLLLGLGNAYIVGQILEPAIINPFFAP